MQEAIQLMCVKASVFSVVVRSMQSLRGDWTMVKDSLHFPAWNEPGGMLDVHVHERRDA